MHFLKIPLFCLALSMPHTLAVPCLLGTLNTTESSANVTTDCTADTLKPDSVLLAISPNKNPSKVPSPVDSEPGCGVVACPGPGADGHAYCRQRGCDYCVQSLRTVGLWYECDGAHAVQGVGVL